MGFGSPDDAEVWERVQRGTKGGEDLPILVNRGLIDEQPGALGPRAISAPKPACAPPTRCEEDDVAMNMMTKTNDLALLQKVSAFLWEEAALLDAKDYDTWLSLWLTEGFYTLPIGEGDDFDNQLNLCHDNDRMRRDRIQRFQQASRSPRPRRPAPCAPSPASSSTASRATRSRFPAPSM